jgi:hypothetical protein
MFPDPLGSALGRTRCATTRPASSATGSLVRGAAWARWPSRSSKPVRCGSPTLGRFDSGAAPSKGLRDSMRDPRHTRQLGGAHDHPLGSAGNRPDGLFDFPATFPRAASESAGACVIASASRKLASPLNGPVNDGRCVRSCLTRHCCLVAWNLAPSGGENPSFKGQRSLQRVIT